MDDIRRNLIILSLNNLIDDYNYALEEAELTQEEKDFMQACIEESKIYLKELIIDIEEPIKRPSWDHL